MNKPGRLRMFFAAMALTMVALVAVCSLLFTSVLQKYRANVAAESAEHLVEISAQIKLYVEESLSNDWRVTQSVAQYVANAEAGDAKQLYAVMLAQREIWSISNIRVYTESGYSVDCENKALANDEASETVYRARKNGRDMAIQQSTVTCTLPVESQVQINGSPIVAVSVVQNLETFIDGMGLRSFDGEAMVYLARQGGTSISWLSHAEAPEAYNVVAIFDGLQIDCLCHAGETLESVLSQGGTHTFLVHGAARDLYLVTAPVETGGESFRLLYLVPEKIVNRTMDSFSEYITALGLGLMLLFCAVVLIVFLTVYLSRKREFETAILVRERMFDLLVRNTRNAFALLSTEQAEPLYVSSNAPSIIGEQYISLVKTETGYCMKSASGRDSEAARHISADMVGWDGESEFVSGYVPCTADEQTRYFVMRLYPAGSGVHEFVGIAQDMTKERERQETLHGALAIADSANQAKTRFLANMSHDIRTPMNAIVNMTRFALENADDPEQVRTYLRTIQGSSDHLLHLINDILDMSRIESGQDAAASEPFDLPECLAEIAALCEPLCTEKRQHFVCDFSGIQSPKLIGDKLKLSQILINLLNNAVKFTPEGGTVRFTVADVASLRSELAALRFTVGDTGIGISEESLTHIFEPFKRDDGNAQVRYIEGTGLGLSICKSYASLMGGTIHCTSKRNKGSVFTMDLSFIKDMEQPEYQPLHAENQSPSFNGMRALVCEDNFINQTIANKILTGLGFAVEFADDGSEAVERFSQAAPGYFDVIYMDIQMPVMGGYEATMAIRVMDRPDAKSVPIIAMTANVFAEDVEKARAAA